MPLAMVRAKSPSPNRIVTEACGTRCPCPFLTSPDRDAGADDSAAPLDTNPSELCAITNCKPERPANQKNRQTRDLMFDLVTQSEVRGRYLKKSSGKHKEVINEDGLSGVWAIAQTA